MVFDELIGLQHVTTNLAAEVRLLGGAALAGQRLLALLLLELGQPRLEDAQRRLFVRSLRALVLALDDDACGDVCDSHGGIRLVHVLPPGPARTVGVDSQLALVELDVLVLGQEWADDHLCEGGMAAVRLIEWRQANEPVDATLRLEDAVRILALDREGGGFQPRLLARARLDKIGLEAAVRGPAQIHPQQDLGPVPSVGTAGAGVDRDDRVGALAM